MIKEMNKDIFREYLEKTIQEIIIEKNIQPGNYFFSINPILEPGKYLNGKDEVMRLQLLSEKNIGGRLLEINEVVGLLAFFSPFVPVWIKVNYLRSENDKVIFSLDCSMRLRNPSILGNQDTGHPPFKAII